MVKRCLASCPSHKVFNASWRQKHDTRLFLSPQNLKDVVDIMLELGYDSSMKYKLMKNAVALNILCCKSARVRQTVDVLREAGIAERVVMVSVIGEHAVSHK
jgi:hypothetical protein